jgi:hypothetical protein
MRDSTEMAASLMHAFLGILGINAQHNILEMLLTRMLPMNTTAEIPDVFVWLAVVQSNC